MKALRTPDDRFRGLPDFPFTPHYVEVANGDDDHDDTRLRVHYLDEGPSDGPVVLLMHGEPSWCFLYRKMIPVLTDAGLRCIAPDLVGFGRSDKPTERADYSYARHVEWMRAAVFDALDLREVTFVGQDWGGLIGLRLVAEHPERFARVVTANPFLTAFSDQDAITRGGDRVFQREVPGCAGEPHTTIEGGGHFLQEDKGVELARVIADWLAGARR